MAPKTSTPGADTPTKPPAEPAEPKKNGKHDSPNNPIKTMYNHSKPGINSARKAALPSDQLPIREAPQSTKKPSGATGHKRNNSDDSTLSMQVSPSDRDDDPSREHSPDPDQSRVREGAEDMSGIGSVFQARSSPKKN